VTDMITSNAGARSGRIRTVLRALLANEAAGGLVLMAVGVLALVVANSPLAPAYFGALKTYVLGLSILHWINDALMAVFFLLVGLEIKREMLDGQLRTWPDRALPGIAALGGMLVPALIYVAVNWQTPETLRGWAIPAATDIAFSLGVLAALGSRVPLTLKVFLTTLAIVDDLGAIVVIAAFYTSDLSPLALGLAALFIVGLAILNFAGVRRLLPYLLLGALLWVSVLKSGVHATLAGVVLALFIPLKSAGEPDEKRPAIRLEHVIKPWSAWLIMPVFAFANAGLPLGGLSLASLMAPLPLGIMAGLFIGKQIGIVLGAGLLIVLGVARLPQGATWRGLYGVAILGGIGFTMSLFIGSLAFPDDATREAEVRLGVLAGSILSAVVGWLVLRSQRKFA
jgi:Na+:H+ antiporter, NhaA family